MSGQVLDYLRTVRDNSGSRGAMNANATLTLQPTREADMAKRPLPSQGFLSKVLLYDPETGLLTWKERPSSLFRGERAASLARGWNKKFAGKPAFRQLFKAPPYFQGAVNGTCYSAHRIIWKLVHGHDPDYIDHINGVKTDNRLVNLRDVHPLESARNKPRFRNNTSGHVGVCFHKKAGKWHARIKVNYQFIGLGYFTDKDAAIAARKLAEKKYGFHQNHGRNNA